MVKRIVVTESSNGLPPVYKKKARKEKKEERTRTLEESEAALKYSKTFVFRSSF